MNVKHVLFVLSALTLAVAACTVPMTTSSPAAANVKVVSVAPPADCKFIAGVMGDFNGGDPGRFMMVETMTDDIRTALQNNAARLGGNLVYVRGAYMGKPDVSNDYFNQFYVNDIEYNGLVYKCP